MKKTKIRIFTCILAVMLCMTAFSATVFASDGGGCESDETGEETPVNSITVSTEDVSLPEDSDSEALTPDGNLSLIDDVYQVESCESDESELEDKQFIVVQTKNGNYFYIVIDRSGGTENVYFLNLVDEADLLALMDEEEIETLTSGGGDEDAGLNTDENDADDSGDDTSQTDDDKDDADTDEKSGSGSSLLLIVLLVAMAGGGALYWFKFRKNKPKIKGNSDLDDYDYGEDEDEDEIEYEAESDDAQSETKTGDEQ